MYAMTRASLWVGLLGIAGFVPLLIFGLWGGAVADAVDRRKLLLASSALLWAATLGLLVQALLGVGSPVLLLALIAVQSAGVRDHLADPQRDHAPAGARPTWCRPPTR